MPRHTREQRSSKRNVKLYSPQTLAIEHPNARVVELVDTRDLKSLVRKDVPVQVRPRAPFIIIDKYKKDISTVRL